MSGNEPLDYAAAEVRHRRPPALWAHIRLTIGAFGAWMVVFAVLVYLVPRFAQVLKDFRAELPASTQNVLWASRFMASGGWLYTLAVPVGIIALGMLIDAMSASSRPVRLYSVLMTLLLMLAVAGFAVLAFASLYAPLISTVQAIQ